MIMVNSPLPIVIQHLISNWFQF